MVGLETCRFSDDDEINNSEETYQYLLKNMKKLVFCGGRNRRKCGY